MASVLIAVTKGIWAKADIAANVTTTFSVYRERNILNCLTSSALKPTLALTQWFTSSVES
jgi:hypothetical protein